MAKKAKKATPEEKVYAVGFKGFGPGMVCRGKQYAENTVFEEDKAEICESGMHFCENPLDVLEYYPLLNDDGKPNEFATVEALSEPRTDGQKSVTTKLRIGAKLSLKSFVKAAVDFSIEWMKKNNSDSGNSSQLAASGNYSQLAASGDSSQLAASGYSSKLAASGHSSKLAASGDCNSIEATGKDSVIASVGISGKVKGAMGCFLACAEWEQNDNGEWHPVAFVSGKVDGETLKPDVWYTVKGGKWVEVKE